MPTRRRFAASAGALALPLLSETSLAKAVTQTDPTIIPVSIESRGVALGGEIHAPPVGPVRAAIALVHGAGRTRRMSLAAQVIAQAGFAVITYDKRGVGQSGGSYEEANNTSPENLDLLAHDAAMALRVIRSRPELAGTKTGYWGISQAGWIIPIAMERFESSEFFVLWSGPVCTVAEEMEAGVGRGGNISGDEEARQFIEDLRTQNRDTDPREFLRQISAKGLWLFGGRDDTLPVLLSIARLQGLIEGGQAHFEYWLDSAGEHSNFAASQPIWQGMIKWMQEAVE